MSTPTISWDETAPAAATAASLGDDRIREMKTQIREVIAVDHEMASSGQTTTTGYHEDLHLKVQASTPSAVANTGNLYTKDVSAKAELHFQDEDANEIQITTAGRIKKAGRAIKMQANADTENLTDSTWTAVTLVGNVLGTAGDWTANHYVAPYTGYYQVNAAVSFYNSVAQKQHYVGIYAGAVGAETRRAEASASSGETTYANPSVSDIVYLTAGQSIKLYGMHQAGVNTVDVHGDSSAQSITYMSIAFLGD